MAASEASDSAKLTAMEAAAALQSGALTAEALARACLARIALRDAAVQAWAHFDAEKVLAAAKASDLARSRGQKLGPLAGIPIGIKDIIDTVDYPTENGTPVFAGRRPSTDASVVTQLKAAGAIIFGKTVTTELAFCGPRTNNCHDASPHSYRRPDLARRFGAGRAGFRRSGPAGSLPMRRLRLRAAGSRK